jgi:hypothetical protein
MLRASIRTTACHRSAGWRPRGARDAFGLGSSSGDRPWSAPEDGDGTTNQVALESLNDSYRHRGTRGGYGTSRTNGGALTPPRHRHPPSGARGGAHPGAAIG